MCPPSSPPPLINVVSGISCLYKKSLKLKQQHCMKRDLEREERAHFKKIVQTPHVAQNAYKRDIVRGPCILNDLTSQNKK